ncbi:MAG: glycosyltransferase family 2 protein [Pseudomonadota bacterium]
MTPQCDIIIPVYNQVDITLTCLTALIQHTDKRHPIWIVDDCSRESDFERLKAHVAQYPHIRVLRRPENGGFSATVNYGIERTTSEYICLLNNDTEVTSGWLETLLDHLTLHPDIGIVNPASNQFKFTPEESSAAPPDSRILMNGATGFCMVFKRDITHKIGLFDTIYGRGYYEDTDFCYRARKMLGLRTAIVLNAFVYHWESQSFGRKSKERYALKRRNHEIFSNRWGIENRFLFLVPQKNESLFRKHFDSCCRLADNRNRITVITNAKRLFTDIHNPFTGSLPHHGNIKSMYIGLPFLPVFAFSFLKWITSGKRYSKLLVFTKRVNGPGDNPMFVAADNYHRALANLL